MKNGFIVDQINIHLTNYC